MSIVIGSRATYRGRTVVVVGRSSYLDGERPIVRWRSGQSFTGFTCMTVAEEALSNIRVPTWEIDDEVSVGWAPYHRRGTVTAILQEAGRTLYVVTFPEDRDCFTTEEGTAWIQDAYDITVGAEALDTST